MSDRSNLKTVVLTGTITLNAPYAASWPGQETGGKKHLPTTLPRIATADGELRPFIAGSGIRGAMRRAALLTMVEASGVRLPTLADYHYNAVGGAKGKKDKDDKAKGKTEADKTEAEAKSSQAQIMLGEISAIRQRNPILGLFGAGESGVGQMLHGHIYVGNAVPVDDVRVEIYGGSRADDTNSRIDLVSAVTDEATIDEQIRTARESKAERKRIKDEIAALVKKRAAARKKNDDSFTPEDDARLKFLEGSITVVEVQQPLAGFEYMAPTSMPHRIVLAGVTDAELGLFLASLDTMMRNSPFLGAHRATGFGEFSAAWDVAYVRTGAGIANIGNGGAAETVGRIEATPHVGLTFDNPDVFADALDAFRTMIETRAFDLCLPAAGDLGEVEDVSEAA